MDWTTRTMNKTGFLKRPIAFIFHTHTQFLPKSIHFLVILWVCDRGKVLNVDSTIIGMQGANCYDMSQTPFMKSANSAQK